MERIRNRKSSGFHSGTLRTWGMLFLASGIVGRSILQNRLLGLGQITAVQLLEVMNSSETAMIVATVALVLKAIETCAVPIFAFLLVEGYQHTSNFKNYFLRVLGIAALSELPYNLAMSGKLLDFSSRNPVFGLVLSLIVMYFYTLYAEKSGKNILFKAVVTLAAVIWVPMLRIEYGVCTVLIVATLWAFRKKPMLRTVAGATMTIACSMTSLFFMVAPMSFLIIHGYNGEKGGSNRLVNYLAYPVILLAVGLVSMFVL